MTSEADVQRTIIEALVWDGWMVLRINQGGAKYQYGFDSEKGEIRYRYVRYSFWQVLGLDPQDSGIGDVIAMKITQWISPILETWGGIQQEVREVPQLLAVECKAPGKKAKLQAALDENLGEDGPLFQGLSKREKGQARFLFAIRDHGGIAIVADDLADIEPYLERAKVQ